MSDAETRISELLRDGDRAEALRLAQSHAFEAPADPDAWMLLSRVAHVCGDADAALAAADSALAVDPSSAENFFHRGWIRLTEGASAFALEDFDRTVELDPAGPHRELASLLSAEALLRLGRPADALARCEGVRHGLIAHAGIPVHRSRVVDDCLARLPAAQP